MNKYTYSAAFVLLGTLSLTTFAKTDTGVYKWIDADKKTHYTDRPAPGKIVEKDIEEKIRKAAGLAAKKTAETDEKDHRYTSPEAKPSEHDSTNSNEPTPTNTTLDATTTESTKTEKPLTKQQIPETYAKKLAAYCDQKTSNLAILQQDAPVAWEEKGKTSLLSAEQRKEKIKEIQSVMSNKCAT